MSEQNAADAAAAAGNANGAETTDQKVEQKPESLEVKIKDQNENETIFKIKKQTKFGKVFEAYCNRQGLTRNTVRFLFEGARIQDFETPEDLEIEDGDQIQAVLEQIGGAAEDDAEGGGESKVAKVSVRVKDANGQEVEFKCKPTTVLKRLMDAFCKQQGRNPDTLRFFTSSGKRVNATDTPASLELEDGELLDVHEEQQGGGN